MRTFKRLLLAMLFISLSLTTHAQEESQPENVEIVWDIAWNSDGTQYAVSSGPDYCSRDISDAYDIHIFDATTHNIIQTLSGNRCYVTSLAWNADDTLLAGTNSDSQFVIWDIDGTLLTYSTGPYAAGAWSFDWHPSGDGSFLLISGYRVAIFDSIYPSEMNFIWDIESNIDITEARWEPMTGHVITGDEQGHIQRWDTETSEVLDTLAQHNSSVIDIEINGQQLAAASREGEISIIDLADDSIINTLYGTPEYFLRDVVWKPDGSQIAVAVDNMVRIYDVSSGELVKQLDSNGQVTVVSWSPDGTQLVYGGGYDAINKLVRVPDHMLCKRCKG